MHALQQHCLDVSRRHFLSQTGLGIGRAALAGLLTSRCALPSAGATASGPGTRASRTRLPSQAKHVIHLFMGGAPSQFELFDHKPELARLEGSSLPPSVIGDQRYAFIRSDAAVLGSRFAFGLHGQCGAEISTAAPHLAEIVDDICILKAVHTDQFNHAPAQIYLSTGFAQPGRPSLGSWVLYGLGAMSDNLPAYVVMNTGGGLSGGSTLWSSGFMPTKFAGVRFRTKGDPILDVSSPPGIDDRLQRDTFSTIRALNRQQVEIVGDPEIESRISAYEMAARLQTSAPELTDLASEDRATLDLYGCDQQEPSFARACLLARRMVERGVRFITIYHEGWDAHSDVEGNVRENCEKTDRASAALVKDLKQRGMLDETIVVWGGEFGRTPMVESNPALGRKLGRDHHPQAYSMWMAGGGVRPGMSFGATDDFGFHGIENRVHIHDVLATILQSLGLDHQRLSINRQGLDFRLTGVEPRRVIHEILS